MARKHPRLMMIPADQVFTSMNEYGRLHKPFIFSIDFGVKNGFFVEPGHAEEHGIFFRINGFSNFQKSAGYESKPVKISKTPVKKSVYDHAFNTVEQNLVAGNSYLTNLTFPTSIKLNIDLPDVFARSNAKYCLLYKEDFIVFSPETFVQIRDGRISSFPMKGTIDASLPDAERVILTDPKETAEHNTIVDLIRNDLSMVADDVRVDRFRYIERINTHEKTLLQVSSEISGVLPRNYNAELGSIFKALLPAGFISGAPKAKTLEIIQEAETYSRGFYTGVFGHFDGANLDSGVMIRFIENKDGELTFYSGGGITVNSNPDDEYNELIDKVYVPFI